MGATLPSQSPVLAELGPGWGPSSPKTAPRFPEAGIHSTRSPAFCPTVSPFQDQVKDNTCLWKNDHPSFIHFLNVYSAVGMSQVRFWAWGGGVAHGHQDRQVCALTELSFQ